MAADTQPKFTAVPSPTVTNFGTANTARDGTGTITTLLTADTDGTRVEAVEVTATGTTTAGVIRLFRKTASGDTWRLFREILVPAITPSTTVDAWNHKELLEIVLASGNMLGISTHNAETFNAFVECADYS